LKNIHNNLSEQTYDARRQIRDQIETLRSRVELLSGRDRLLMEMYLDRGSTYCQIARLAGVHHSSICRRIRRITKRLTDGKYVKCLRHSRRLGPQRLKIARDYFLQGLSQRKIAEKTGYSLYRVRKMLDEIKRIIEEEE